MGAISRCLGACQLFQCGEQLTGGRPGISQNLGPFVCRFNRHMISSRALGAKGRGEFRDDRVGVFKNPSALLAGEISSTGRSRMDVIRNRSSFGRLSRFLSASSPPSGNRLLARDLHGYLQRGHALFSTSASEMAARMSVGGAGNQIQNDVPKKESADNEVTDMKILLITDKNAGVTNNCFI